MLSAKSGFLAVLLAVIMTPVGFAQTPSSEYATVPSPGPLSRVASVGDFSLRYPSNWTEVQQSGSWMFFPPEGVVEKGGKPYYRYGFWVIPVGSGQSTAGNLQPTANRFFFALQRANPGMFEVSENDKTVLGGPAVSMNFENNTPPGAPDEPEMGTLLTVLVASSHPVVLLMFAPKRDMVGWPALPSKAPGLPSPVLLVNYCNHPIVVSLRSNRNLSGKAMQTLATKSTSLSWGG